MQKSLEVLTDELKRYDISHLMLELNKHGEHLRNSASGDFELWTFESTTSEYLMDFVGLTREVAFRGEGGGSGKNRDIDDYDLGQKGVAPFKQLVAVKDGRILGGYRYAQGKDLVDENGDIVSPSSRLVNMSREFKKNYLPCAIELGRSYALDYRVLWALIDGLGAISVESGSRYLYGKITRFPVEDKAKDKEYRGFFNHYAKMHHRDDRRLITLKLNDRIRTFLDDMYMNYEALGN